jgi:hypothetical protein
LDYQNSDDICTTVIQAENYTQMIFNNGIYLFLIQKIFANQVDFNVLFK